MVDELVLSQQDQPQISFSTPYSRGWCHLNHFLWWSWFEVFEEMHAKELAKAHLFETAAQKCCWL